MSEGLFLVHDVSAVVWGTVQACRSAWQEWTKQTWTCQVWRTTLCLARSPGGLARRWESGKVWVFRALRVVGWALALTQAWVVAEDLLGVEDDQGT